MKILRISGPAFAAITLALAQAAAASAQSVTVNMTVRIGSATTTTSTGIIGVPGSGNPIQTISVSSPQVAVSIACLPHGKVWTAFMTTGTCGVVGLPLDGLAIKLSLPNTFLRFGLASQANGWTTAAGGTQLPWSGIDSVAVIADLSGRAPSIPFYTPMQYYAPSVACYCGFSFSTDGSLPISFSTSKLAISRNYLLSDPWHNFAYDSGRVWVVKTAGYKGFAGWGDAIFAYWPLRASNSGWFTLTAHDRFVTAQMGAQSSAGACDEEISSGIAFIGVADTSIFPSVMPKAITSSALTGESLISLGAANQAESIPTEPDMVSKRFIEDTTVIEWAARNGNKTAWKRLLDLDTGGSDALEQRRLDLVFALGSGPDLVTALTGLATSQKFSVAERAASLLTHIVE
jgi:hypothetical protein